ncbi:Ribosomal large subunit pseudouridine synthase C [Novipirellula aureliae]|uniref:Ribosomal large subunit pseudouridine synthase C n=1 Tax=Novipirellula aureliae TaxID=2527966 RepID=A0A5C6DLE2_9BACT|nr:RluA family pseudouridine synthase [Novipirellula aureliae]TWU36627.1 Ribosomal large subunit pseudouridine synthase C [Novipirellula aureliae]
MTSSPLEILYEDNHLLVINKPSGLATMGAESGDSLHSVASEYLRTRYNKPGRAFLGVVSRLDAMTSGVIVMAKTSKAASRLTPQFAPPIDPWAMPKKKSKPIARASKIYLAVVEGCLPEYQSTEAKVNEFNGFVYKDDAAKRMRVCHPQKENAKNAVLRYTILKTRDDATLLAVQLMTGRKHQIRVQFADRGFPIWADRKYGGRNSLEAGIALHSWQLSLMHPTKGERMTWQTSPPKAWRSFGKLVMPQHELKAVIPSRFEITT